MSDSTLRNYRTRTMGLADLEQVLTWRNHPNIRRYMYTQHEITLEEHRNWFEQASQDPHRHLLVFECDEKALGFVNFTQLDSGNVADWGFYIAPGAPKGGGLQLGRSALEYAFQKINLHKVCGQALAFNDRSISFHSRLGFQQEGILRDQNFDGERYHSVVCFGLLDHEWKSNQ